MLRKRTPRSLLILLIIILLLMSCSLPRTTPTGYAWRDPNEVKLDVIETAALLQTPDRLEEGIWSLLANLGIGVYTGDGTQIMPGSEANEASFWLYDFEIPLLVGMAGGRAVPFHHYFGLLKQNGFDGSEQELLSVYKVVYNRYPEEYLVQTFDEMGMTFEAGLILTPLQEWLLLLDTFVPPNKDIQVQGSYPAAGYTGLLALSRLRQGAPCGEIRGGGILPYWGLMQREHGGLSVAAAVSAIEYYYIIHGPLISSAATPSLHASRESGHEGHGGKGDRFEYTLEVQVQFAPWPSIPVAEVSCGAFVDLNWKPLVGGLANVPVEWMIPYSLSSHGSTSRKDAGTDQQGKAMLIIQLQEEEGGGLGPYREESGQVLAYVNLREGFQSAGIYDERLLSFVPTYYPLGPLPVNVSWHEACDSFTLHYLAEMQQKMPMLNYSLVVDGPIEVSFDNSVEPPQLHGGETLPVTGGGSAGECTFTVTGYDTVWIEGTVTPSEGADPPALNMVFSHEMDIQMEGEVCGGGMLTPISSQDDELQLLLRGGERLENKWDVGMISGRTVYQLEVDCEE